jgi:hypothetical protein
MGKVEISHLLPDLYDVNIHTIHGIYGIYTPSDRN